jgi:hypothetical protein
MKKPSYIALRQDFNQLPVNFTRALFMQSDTIDTLQFFIACELLRLILLGPFFSVWLCALSLSLPLTLFPESAALHVYAAASSALFACESELVGSFAHATRVRQLHPASLCHMRLLFSPINKLQPMLSANLLSPTPFAPFFLSFAPDSPSLFGYVNALESFYMDALKSARRSGHKSDIYIYICMYVCIYVYHEYTYTCERQELNSCFHVATKNGCPQ